MSADPSGGGPAGPPPGPEVVIYTRPGCHLCEDALAILADARAHVRFRLREVDIESDAALFKRYLERIPVVVIDGAEAFELFVEQARLQELVVKAGGGSAPQVE